ncbi:hypothetical protein DEU56DRAFT_950286 [Suillus clintonianus]|uniref:uncharacterized protein n=1 Tax=Suillus clintonianus TaxID=1904413 RepID=UPI001B85DD65|nr:uncharacterized protein DEU56DRAFT_950286 [Suillus clintonianus]KAG2134100.1 hypothetical protein DEU56DRAFT_950286 [Suillus clintonianus]
MSDSASQLASEAKSTHQSLKELLKTRLPWDKEVEFQRKSLRRLYLRLLFVDPYAKESKDAETHLWMQTSYQFISNYKQSVATLDRTLQSAPRHQPRQSNHGPVEYRKLMQRFRQFLAEEEKFWTQLVARYQRSFSLHEAQHILSTLNIAIPDDLGAPNGSIGVHEGVPNSGFGRNQFQFPLEGNTPSPTSSAERETNLAILSKAIVCLGDMERYRELYNEGGGRPRAGQEDGTGSARRGGRNRRGGAPGFDSVPRARNYDKAVQCYEQARRLVPSEGNPSHQLAILAFYQNDMFSSLLHYYRALCVRQPYDTASENVKKILNKSLDQHAKRTREGVQAAPEIGDLPPRLRVESFKEKVVLLHALWRLGSDKSRLNPIVHAADVVKDFAALVAERVLPIENVTKVIVLSEGALWKHIMIRDTSPPSNRRSGGIPDPATVESQILKHILAIHQSLLKIGAGELDIPPEDTTENDLAQCITAAFRRTLPALRVASKWLLANLKYVARTTSPAGSSQVEETPGVVNSDMPAFWEDYLRFYNALKRLFPIEKLPSLLSPLEEDEDLRGFLPLRNLMIGDTPMIADVDARRGNGLTTAGPQGRDSVHPNEEQLMRISDLLKDVRKLAESPDSPIHLQGDTFKSLLEPTGTAPVAQAQAIGADAVQGLITPVVSRPDAFDLMPLETYADEDAMTDTGRTDNDDPIEDAFRTVLNAEVQDEGDELDDDVVVWDPRASTSPVGVVSALPMTPILPSSMINGNFISPSASSIVSPGRAAPPSPPSAFTGTTAQDLLNSFSKAGGDIARSPRRQPIAPPSQFLFGSGPENIWSTTRDQNPPNLSPRPAYSVEHNVSTPNNRAIHPSNRPPPLSSFAHSQSPWSPSFEFTHDPSNIHTNHSASQPSDPGHHHSLYSANTIQSSPSYQAAAYSGVSHQPFAYPQESLYLNAEIAPAALPPQSGLHYQQGGFNLSPSVQQQYPRPMQHYSTSSIWGNIG